MTTIVPRTNQRKGKRRIETTLLDIVTAVSDAAASDAETVAVMHHLLASGRVRLLGQATDFDFTKAA